MMDFSKRSEEPEIMDDLKMEGPELRKTLDLLARINQWLGGNSVILNGVKKLLQSHSSDQVIRIIDLGCGNGDMLRQLNVMATDLGYSVKLLGIDANSDAIEYAKELSVGIDNLEFSAINIFSEEFKAMEYDIALSTLFLHHFTDAQISEFLPGVQRQASTGVIVNDLQRSYIAHGLFWVISMFFNNPVAREDGLISIRKAFRRKDLERYADQFASDSSIVWRWAFRYQWIIRKK